MLGYTRRNRSRNLRHRLFYRSRRRSFVFPFRPIDRIGVFCEGLITGIEIIKNDDMDLCILLGNALTNAIEACERIKEPNAQKEIYMNMKYKNGNLLIELNNTYSIETIKRTSNKFVSSKRFRGENSLGIGNIQTIVDKYKGVFKVEMTENTFKLKMMIPDQ